MLVQLVLLSVLFLWHCSWESVQLLELETVMHYLEMLAMLRLQWAKECMAKKSVHAKYQQPVAEIFSNKQYTVVIVFF